MDSPSTTIYDRSPFRSILAWASRMSSSYISLLRQDDLLALAILAHYYVFVMLLEDIGWMGDMGRDEIGKIIAFMEAEYGETRQEWESLVEWPRSMVRITDEIRRYRS